MQRWIKPIIDMVAILLVFTAAKVAIAEPYYVPSGSMEPTLQIGNELLATKYP
jgi:signal peptidase I